MKNKKTKLSKLFFIIPAIVIVAMAVLFLVPKGKVKHLRIYSEAGYKISEYTIKENGTFTMAFMHSVNKSPVIDSYKIDKDNNIYLFRTVYYNYGAGVPTDLESGQKLTYGEDGSMIIDGIDKKIDDLTYFVSEQSDHVLTIIGDKAISLWHDAGKNVKVKIKIED